MKKFILIAATISFLFSTMSIAEAVILDFEDQNNLGIIYGHNMSWNNIGGGHLFMPYPWQDGYIEFSSPLYVNSFEMNANPYDFGTWSVGTIDVAAFNNTSEVWSDTIDLTDYGDWNDWLIVEVGVGEITKLIFYGSSSTGGSLFRPSIDNINVVPEPATMLLLGSALLVLAGIRRKFK